MKQLVSIILTVYNEEALVSSCLESLITQTYQPREIIVVDDGSKDRSIEEIRKYKVKLVKQKHLGLGPSRNRGAKEASGEIVVFCDADLAYDRDYVASLVKPIIEGRVIGTFHLKELVKNPENYWSRCWQINDHLPKDRKIPEDFSPDATFFRAIKRDDFLMVGGYDDTGYLDDRTLFGKLNKRSLGVEEATCWHTNPQTGREVFNEARWHGRSLSRNNLQQSILQYFPLNTLRRIILDTLYFKEPLYFLFKTVFDTGILLGLFEGLSGRSLAK